MSQIRGAALEFRALKLNQANSDAISLPEENAYNLKIVSRIFQRTFIDFTKNNFQTAHGKLSKTSAENTKNINLWMQNKCYAKLKSFSSPFQT